MIRNVLSIILLMLFLGACTMAPKYTRPALSIPSDWPSGKAYKKVEAAPGTPIATERRTRVGAACCISDHVLLSFG